MGIEILLPNVELFLLICPNERNTIFGHCNLLAEKLTNNYYKSKLKKDANPIKSKAKRWSSLL